LELRDLDQAQVCRDLVAGFQQHDVARHQRAGRHHLHLAAAQHGGVRRCQLAQRRHGLVGAPGLHKTNERVEHHDHQDDHGVGGFSHQPGDHRRAEQHQHHEVLELLDQQRQRPPAGVVLQLVGAMLRGAARGLIGVQAGIGIDAVGLRQLLRVAQVGVVGGGGGDGFGRHAEQSANRVCGRYRPSVRPGAGVTGQNDSDQML